MSMRSPVFMPLSPQTRALIGTRSLGSRFTPRTDSQESEMTMHEYEAAPEPTSIDDPADTPSESLFHNPVLARTGGSTPRRGMNGWLMLVPVAILGVAAAGYYGVKAMQPAPLMASSSVAPPAAPAAAPVMAPASATAPVQAQVAPPAAAPAAEAPVAPARYASSYAPVRRHVTVRHAAAPAADESSAEVSAVAPAAPPPAPAVPEIQPPASEPPTINPPPPTASPQ